MARGVSVSSAPASSHELNADGSGFERERVVEIQRARMLSAMTEAACERGVANTSVAHVVDRAGVSRRTFYEVFDDRDDCFLAALEEAVACAQRCVSEARELKAGWVEGIRGGLGALLQFLQDEPTMGRLLVVEWLGGGAKALELRRHTFSQLIGAVDAGGARARTVSPCTLLTAEGVVGGVFSVIHAQMVGDEQRRFVDMLNPLMSMIVLPYLGPAAARRESERPVTALPARASSTAGGPLKDLGMRLTYRTVRALVAVAEHPRSSNRLIGEASGIGDQGQVSKLLARLEKLGLVENARTGPPKGASNIWVLTERGGEVADVFAAQVTS